MQNSPMGHVLIAFGALYLSSRLMLLFISLQVLVLSMVFLCVKFYFIHLFLGFYDSFMDVDITYYLSFLYFCLIYDVLYE